MGLAIYIPDEQSRRDLKGILSEILREIAPNEVSRFDAIKDISDSADLQKQLGVPRVRTRGIPGVEFGSVCLHLVAGTLALIEIYRKKKEHREQQELEYDIRQAWQEALIQAGMSPELARLIPVKFSPDMIRFLTRTRFQETQKP
jgi:hypothetical protein